MTASSVSILLCTRNRAASLGMTLDAIARLEIPPGAIAELLVIDNGSTDDTAALVRRRSIPGIDVKYLFDNSGGKSAALNRAVAEADGEVLLFLDDDIRPAADWLVEMCRPIAEGRADAVAGIVRMAPHLRRPWMEAQDFLAFACNEGIARDSRNGHLVGASMAVSRRVFQAIGGFDPEIGPGVSTGGEDFLLSLQISAAGMHVAAADGGIVEHHFDPQRLTRSSLRRGAALGAISDYYIAHHWSHTPVRHPLALALGSFFKLQYYRLRRFGHWWRHPAMPAWERMLIQEMHAWMLHWKHRHSPRNYQKFGLVKIHGKRPANHIPDRHVRAGL